MEEIAAPSLSIVVPAFNEVGNLDFTIRGVIAAIGPRCDFLEVLIIDDCSFDGTAEISNALAEEFPQVRVVHNAENMGLGYNYKLGLEMAHGEHFLLVPGDNEIEEESIANMLGLVGKADIIIPFIQNYAVRPRHRQWLSKAYTFIIDALFGLEVKYFNGCVIHRTEMLRKVPPRTEGFAYQADILVRMLKAGCTYIEVGMNLRPRAMGGSKALNVKNLKSVARTFVLLLKDVYVTREVQRLRQELGR